MLTFITIVALACLSCGDPLPSAKKRSGTPEDTRPVTTSMPANSVGNTETNKVSESNENDMAELEETAESSNMGAKFYAFLESALEKRGMKTSDICDESHPVQKRILNEYGALFLTDQSALPPPTCMFTSSEQVFAFQNQAGIQAHEIANAQVELQPAAMKALLAARDEAKSQGMDITPRDGAEAGRRGFDDTLRLWNSRFEPACDYWMSKGKLSAEQVARLKSLPIIDQVREVLELEKRGIYFAKSLDKSILYSVAAPGTSQHLSMLAIDINEFENKAIRKIMANHGWFRTVKGDAPHFTYLGVKEDQLKNMGLKKISPDGEFWIPNV